MQISNPSDKTIGTLTRALLVVTAILLLVIILITVYFTSQLPSATSANAQQKVAKAASDK